MAKRVSIDNRIKRPIDNLFESSIEIKDELLLENKEENKRQTYYISQGLIDALNIYSTFEKVDKSTSVRCALENYIPEKYKKMARDMRKL